MYKFVLKANLFLYKMLRIFIRYRQVPMRSHSTIGLIIAALLFTSCNSSNRDAREAEGQAKSIIHQFDTTTLRLLHDWNYTQRGENGFWSKLSGDATVYNCTFLPSADSPKLRAYQTSKFLKDFDSRISIDTSYGSVEFTRIGQILSLSAKNNRGRDTLLMTNLSLTQTFPNQNPFDVFGKLTKLKDDLGVTGISHFYDVGGITIFYLRNPQYKLNYIPDTSTISAIQNTFWRDEFARGKFLDKNWNLVNREKK